MTWPQTVVPVLCGLVGWWPFVVALRAGRRGRAAAVVAGWAVCLATALACLERASPGICARLFPGADRYGSDMLTWASTGVGCESQPACFVVQHALHAGGFALATVVSAGAAGLALAGVLFGWMGAYSGALAVASGHPLLAPLLAWHPWALVRVAAYVSLGVALAEPLARRGLPPLAGRWRWLLAGVLGLVLDGTLKALIAQSWWRLVIHPLLVTP